MTQTILEQGQALFRAIEALKPNASPRIRPTWLAEEILSASEGIDRDRMAVWLSEN